MPNQVTEPLHSTNIYRKYNKNVILLYTISLLNGMQFVAPMIIPYFIEWGNLSFQQIMSLQSIYMITIFLTEIPLGAIADCISRRFSLTLGFICTLVGILLYSIIPSFVLFVMAEITWACAGSLISGSDHALMHDSLKKINQGKEVHTSEIVSIYGKYDNFRRLGYLLSIPLGSIISIIIGLHATMISMGVPISVALLLSLFLTKINVNTQKHKSYLRLLYAGFQTIWSTKGFRILLLDEIVVTSLCAHLSMCYQQKLLILGINEIHFGWIFLIYMVSTILGAYIHTPLVKILRKKRRVIFLTTLGAGIGLLILNFAHYIVGVVIGVVLVAGFGLTYSSLRLGYYQPYITSEQRSTVISTIHMIRLLCMSGMSLVVGFLADINLSLVFIIFGAITCVWSFASPIKEKYLEKNQ